MNNEIIITIISLFITFCGIIFYNNIDCGCSETISINDKFNFIDLGKCVRDKFTYEITNDYQPAKISLLKGKGDCKDMAIILKEELDDLGIVNYLQTCDPPPYDDNIIHMRNVVFYDNETYILDISYYENNIIFKKFKEDYCKVLE